MSGNITITSTGSYDLATTLSSGTNIEFIGVGGTLTIEPPAVTRLGVGGIVENFAPGDNLTVFNVESIISDLGYPADSGYAGVLEGYDLVIATDGAVSSNFPEYGFLGASTREQIGSIANDIEQDLFGTGTFSAPITFNVIADPSGSFADIEVDSTATINPEVTCFAAGTRITTERGEVEVENLRIGERVKTLHSGFQPIRWIGTRRYVAPFCNHQKVLPIRISAGALAEGVPVRDLVVSPGHAMCLGGGLVHASRLVNGVSICQAESVEEVEYFHVETANHEVIFAEGAQAETFMGEYFRGQFANAATHEGPGAPEVSCLPRLDDGWVLASVLRGLRERAGIVALPRALRGFVDKAEGVCVGWAEDGSGEAVVLDVLADKVMVGRVVANRFRADVKAAGMGDGFCGFEIALPAGAQEIRVVRAWDQADLPSVHRKAA